MNRRGERTLRFFGQWQVIGGQSSSIRRPQEHGAMGFDLYFTEPRITREEFTAYFRGRPNYELFDLQAWYENEDTGVYFQIDYNDSEEDDPEAIGSTASLSLIYHCPHFFGLEAVDEVSSFIDRFGFSILDPQMDGMGDGPFSREEFLRSWNRGNEFGYSAVLRGDNGADVVWALPGERLEMIWRWNYQKAGVQESFGEHRFVPRVFFVAVGRRAVSVAVWPDAIAELVPKVDFLFILRDELAPKSFFGGRKKDQILLPFDEVVSELQPYATSEYSLPAYRLPAPAVPESLRKRIRTLKSTGITARGISMDQVLNEEIVVKFRKG